MQICVGIMVSVGTTNQAIGIWVDIKEGENNVVINRYNITYIFLHMFIINHVG